MEDEMGTAYGTHWRQVNVFNVLMVKHLGKKPLGRPGRKREDSITMDF